jgi:RimJ/RimL family protein N-acetyltransferase
MIFMAGKRRKRRIVGVPKRKLSAKEKRWPRPMLKAKGTLKEGIDIHAYVGGQRIGGICVTKTYENRAWLSGLKVEDEFLGRGYAKDIVDKALRLCQGKIKTVQGLATNKAVISVFKSLGFEFTKTKKFMRIDVNEYLARQRRKS